MEHFMAMIKEIIIRHRARLSHTTLPSLRLEIINEMKAELLAMKDTYEAINGKIAGTGPSFEDVMKQISN